MPQPTPSDQHVDKILTGFSIKYANDNDAWIANKVFPIIPVNNQSDIYYKFDKGNWFRLDAQKRAPAAESAGGGYTLTTDTYRADVWAIHKDVDDQSLANYDAPLRPFRNATNYVTDQLLLRRDSEWASAFFTTGVWDTDLQGVAGTPGAGQFQQFDQGASVPIDVIKAQSDAVKKVTGKRPNTLVIGADVKNYLFDHSTILDRVKHSTLGVITPQLVSQVLEVDRVVVADAIYNTSQEGQADSMDYIANSKSMLLAYAEQTTPDIENVSAGYTFAWNGLLGSNAFTGRVSRFRMDKNKADRVEIEGAFDMKAVATDCAVFFYDVIA